MSYKQVPITAKILKTTKGGVTQPILNMGADVTVSGLKMKAPSPAQKRSRSGYKTPTPSAPRTKASNPRIKNSRQDIATKSKATIDGEAGRDADDLARKNKTGQYNQARKVGEAGWAADDKARKNKTGIYKPTNNKKSYDQAYKSRDQKTYGKMDKATYIKEAKRQNASKKAGKGYDVKNKTVNTSNNASASNDVATTKVTKKQEAPQSAKNNIAANTKKKVNAKTEPKKEVKKTRSQKLRSKGEKALADGNKAKALRIRRRYDKQVAKETKKKGQAAGAIQPK